MHKNVCRNLTEFYQDETRARSGEADYGVHWRLPGWEHRFRVSYVHDTGEVYAVHQDLVEGSYGPVFVLGIVPPDHMENERDTYYQPLDRILEGWPDHCGTPDGLSWLKQQLARAGAGNAGHAPAGDAK